MIDDDTYARAVIRHTDEVLKMFTGERLINKIFGRVFQSHAMGRLVVAHFEWKAGAGEPPTLARLQAETGCGRTLAAFVGVAKVARLLTSEPNPADRRQKFLVPGPRVIEGLRGWLHHHLGLAESMGAMQAGCAQRLMDDADYFHRLVRSSLVVIDGIPDIRQRFQLWDWFEHHECGLRIAYALLRAHYQACLMQGLPGHGPVPLAVSGGALAQDLGLSKSHVRNVLNGAEELGALAHDESRRRVVLHAPFLHESRGSLVGLMSLFAEAHRRSEQLEQPTASPLPRQLATS